MLAILVLFILYIHEVWRTPRVSLHEIRPGRNILKLVWTSNFKPIYVLKKGKTIKLHTFLQKRAIVEANFLQKLVGTNPNRPHMFRRACALWLGRMKRALLKS